MPQPIDVLLRRLETVVNGSDERRTSFETNRGPADILARRLPLVHRTGHEPEWLDIFTNHRLAAQDVPSEHERLAGRTTSVYFFLGAGAYPKGHIALLLAPQPILDSADNATFSPYDTGGMGHYLPNDWDAQRKCEHLQQHAGDAHDVQTFAGPYLAGHFRDPMTYIRAPQVSTPDFPLFHEFITGNGDRRAWTIEVQCHDDVAITASADELPKLLVVGAHKVLELPDEFRRRASLVADNLGTDALYHEIVAHIEGGAQ